MARKSRVHKCALSCTLCCFAILFGLSISKRGSQTADSELLDGKLRKVHKYFITGDSFRGLCRWRCESRSWREPLCNFAVEDVVPGDCIFVATTNLSTFAQTTAYLHAFDSIRTRLDVPYVLVTHNGDLSTPVGDTWHPNESDEWRENFLTWFDDAMLVHWFAVNCNWQSQKPTRLSCIPLGLENDYIDAARRPLTLGWKLAPRAKGEQVLLAFDSEASKPDRAIAIDALTDRPFITNTRASSYSEWVQLVLDHAFVICPHGHGLDTHRHWEVLLLGSVPVVKTSTLDEMFDTLPVVILQNWTDLSVELLQSWRTHHQAKVSLEAAFMPFWKKKISEAMSRARAIKHREEFDN